MKKITKKQIVTSMIVALISFIVIRFLVTNKNMDAPDIFYLATFILVIYGIVMTIAEKCEIIRKDRTRIGITNYIIMILYFVIGYIVILKLPNLFVLDNLSEEKRRINLRIFSALCSIPATMFIYMGKVKNEKVAAIWTIIFIISCIICGVFETFQNVESWTQTGTTHMVVGGTYNHGPSDNFMLSLGLSPVFTGIFAALGGWIISFPLKAIFNLRRKKR